MTADLEKSVSFYLSKKTVLLQKYLSVTAEFIDALKRRGSDTPEPFLLRRQSLIQEIEDLDRSFQTTGGLLGQRPPELSGRPRESIRERVESMRRILAEAGSRDKALNELAKEESDSLRGDLLRFRTARNAAQGYGKAGGSEPRFLDTRK